MNASVTKSVIAFAITLLTANTAWSADTATVGVSATLRAQISLSVLQNIDFGDILIGDDPTGAIEISPDGSITISGTDVAVGGSVAPQSGQIDVVGEEGQIVDVSCNSAVIANLINESIPIDILVTEAVGNAGTPCAGVGTPVVSIVQPADPAPIFIGGQIDASDLTGIANLEFFSSSVQSGIPAIFQAVYQ